MIKLVLFVEKVSYMNENLDMSDKKLALNIYIQALKALKKTKRRKKKKG